MEKTRAADHPGDPIIKVIREVPVPAVIVGLAFIVGQAFTVYYGLDRLSEKQKESTEQQRTDVARIVTRVDKLVDDANTRATKDLEHDFKLADLERRVRALETPPTRRTP